MKADLPAGGIDVEDAGGIREGGVRALLPDAISPAVTPRHVQKYPHYSLFYWRDELTQDTLRVAISSPCRPQTVELSDVAAVD